MKFMCREQKFMCRAYQYRIWSANAFVIENPSCWSVVIGDRVGWGRIRVTIEL